MSLVLAEWEGLSDKTESWLDIALASYHYWTYNMIKVPAFIYSTE